MPSVVRSPANSDILRRVPRARWTLAASTRQYPFSASRVPELSFLAPFAAPRRLGLDDLAATRKVLALARRGRRVPKVENARLRDVTSGNPNPRGAVARRGVESDANIAFHEALLLRFSSRFRGGVAEYLTGRGFTRGGARGVLVGEIGLSTLDAVSSRRCVARCAVVRPVSRGAMLRRKRGAASSPSQQDLKLEILCARNTHERKADENKPSFLRRGGNKNRAGVAEKSDVDPKKSRRGLSVNFPKRHSPTPHALGTTRASSFPTQFPNTRAKGCSARARPRSRVPPRRAPAVSAAPRDSWSMPRVPRKRN